MTYVAAPSAEGSADQRVRDTVNQLPVPTFPEPKLVTPPPLAEARVAIVTTAGLKPPGEQGWSRDNDQSFRVLPATQRDMMLDHWSPNFDRTGIVADLNVVYPADRLQEMADEGIIGSLGPRNISFMGGLPEADLPTMRYESGPQAARLLLDDGVDVVLLTPI